MLVMVVDITTQIAESSVESIKFGQEAVFIASILSTNEVNALIICVVVALIVLSCQRRIAVISG